MIIKTINKMNPNKGINKLIMYSNKWNQILEKCEE